MMVEVLQLAADGGSSLYKVQVDGRDDSELFMTPYDEQTATVLLFDLSHKTLDRIIIRVVGDDWLKEAHRRVADMLRKVYPDATVAWFTKGMQRG